MLTSQRNTKKQIISNLIEKYGKNYKTPLSIALGVNVSTIRRMFNNDKELSPANKKAILCILNHEN